MINWMLGHTDRFKAYVSHAGVYNLVSEWGATEELFFPEWEFAGPPWENPEMYERWSPYRFAKNFKTPTLVSHGELDFRVHRRGRSVHDTATARGTADSSIFGRGTLGSQAQNRTLVRTVGDWSISG